MIYNLNKHLFDINKLESISGTYWRKTDAYSGLYYFDYQINGFKYTINYYNESDANKERQKLFDSWETNLYYEQIGQ